MAEGMGAEGSQEDPDQIHAEANARQARQLLPYARQHGLRLDAFLVGSQAEDILRMVIRGDFASPEEALHVLLEEILEVRKHRDLCEQAFRRRILEVCTGEGELRSMEETSAILEGLRKNHRPPARWVPVRTSEAGPR